MKAFCSVIRVVEVGPVPLFFGFSAPAAITSAGNARISLIGIFKIEDMLTCTRRSWNWRMRVFSESVMRLFWKS